MFNQVLFNQVLFNRALFNRALSNQALFNRVLIACWLSLTVEAVYSAPLILSGEVAARNSEVFVAPRGQKWMVQITWMVEEGELVKAGDAVVQYDTSGITSELEQLEAALRKAQAESRQEDLSQDLALREAQNVYDVALLNQRKARLDADIPQSLLSQLNYEQYQLELTRSANASKEAKRALDIKKQDVVAERGRSQVEIASAENELQRVQHMLGLMTQYATQDGTALYVDHPWTRKKIRSGEAVQRGFSVLELPANDDLHIKAWLNEIDVAKIEAGMNVSIAFDAKPQVSSRGKIEKVGNQAEPREYWGNSNYIDVEISIIGTIPNGLLPGMSVRVIIEDGVVIEEEPPAQVVQTP